MANIDKQNFFHKKTISVSLTVLFVIILIAAGGLLISKAIQKSHRIVPESIQKQLKFTVLWPDNPSSALGDKSTIKYNAPEKLLTFIAHNSDGNNVTISEQPTPESFIDIPQSYDKLIESMLQYKSFDTPNGKVYLTHPKTLNGRQTAVMNARGVLLFAKPDKDISDDTWVQFFNNLKLLNMP